MKYPIRILALAIICAFTSLAFQNAEAQTIPVYKAYHGVSASQHQTHFNYYSSKGYRMISLSVYGEPSGLQYAAVWVKRAGPAWVSGHYLTAADYQGMCNTYIPQGYRPILISATGSGSSAMYAAVFEKSPATWQAKHGLISGAADNSATIQYWMNWAQDYGYIPLSVTRYGTASTPLYAAIWIANPSNVLWNWVDGVSASDYQLFHDGFTKMRHRPAFPALSTDQLYLGVFRNDQIGPQIAYHGLTASDFQSKFDAATASGYYPISIQGGGTGSGTRYAAVFAKQETPIARVWKATGPTPTGMSSTDAAKFDQAVKDFMQYHGIRAGQLSFSQAGKMLYTRAFTWAETGYPITQTNSPMRIASCSKAFACAGITKLLATYPNLLNEKVFPLLGIQEKLLASQTVDPRVNDITVGQCVTHMTGWRRGSFDPVFDCRNIGQAIGKSDPITNWEMAKYMYGMPLQYTPGTDSEYFNFGYVLLGLVVEKLSNQTFESFMMSQVLQPESNTDVWLARTHPGEILPFEGYYDDKYVGYSAMEPFDNTILPGPHGGGGYLTEAMNTGGGLAATATSLTKFVNKHAAWGMGGRAQGSARTGGMKGTTSRMVSGPRMADYAFIFNTACFKAGTENANNDLAATIETLLGKLPPHVSNLTVSSTAPVGGTVVTGTVTLDWAAPVGGAVVTLTSSNTAAASVPASITILEGSTTGTFNITTYPQTASAVATITAAYNGTSLSKAITVKPPSLLKVEIITSTVTGGTNSTGRIWLTGPTAAPTVVALSSNNSAAATPASIVVPIRASHWDFTISTVPVSANASATITATLSGVSKTATLSVKAPVLLSLTLAPNPVAGGNNVTGTVAMTGPVKADTQVNLTNNNFAASLGDPTWGTKVVVLPAGSATVSFVMTTLRPTVVVTGGVKATVTGVSKSVTLTVHP